MFTGIIENLGSIREIRSSDQGRRLTIETDFIFTEMKIGDSISVNGACLTVVDIDGKRFKADVSPETLTKTILGGAKIGDRVNLERALRLSDRLDGHLVSGHVDGIGIVAKRKTAGNSMIITVRVQESLSRYIINKGSVAIDGVSLTVNRCDGNSFDVTIIPHTAENTTISLYKNGDYVNIETDMIGKYVERFVLTKDKVNDRPEAGELSLDMQFLKKTGFL